MILQRLLDQRVGSGRRLLCKLQGPVVEAVVTGAADSNQQDGLVAVAAADAEAAASEAGKDAAPPSGHAVNM